jgi:hypothetical protein
MIRNYPVLEEAERELHMPSMSQSLTGLPSAHSNNSVVESLAIKELPKIQQREYKAVYKAIKATELLIDGKERLNLINMVFWDQTYTLQGAALKCNICDRTARQWHTDFIRLTAIKFGLL